MLIVPRLPQKLRLPRQYAGSFQSVAIRYLFLTVAIWLFSCLHTGITQRKFSMVASRVIAGIVDVPVFCFISFGVRAGRAITSILLLRLLAPAGLMCKEEHSLIYAPSANLIRCADSNYG